MQRIGVLYNPFSDASTRISLELAEWLSARGINTSEDLLCSYLGARSGPS